VDVYISAQIERLFAMRNAAGAGGRYGGPQISSYSKEFSNRLITDMAKVLGPYTLTDDAEWGLDEDIFEVAQRGALATAPGGTPEAMRINMSRALAIGR
jgi:hypothetical protein